MRELLTDRLRLRSWTDEDVEVLLDLYSRPEVMRYIDPAGVMDPHDREAALASIHRRRGFDDGVHGMWVVESRSAGDFLGQIIAKHIPWSDAYAGPKSAVTEIGWHLHPRSWGHGYATEGARAVLDHLRASGLSRVIAVTHLDNTPSQAVCRRIGLTHRGQTSDFYNQTLDLFDIRLGQVGG